MDWGGEVGSGQCSVVEWSRVDRSVVECSRVEWSRVEWSGVECRIV